MDLLLVEQTRSEWRKLGFFYDSDDEQKEWRLTGSRAGLLAFVGLLRSYVADPRNNVPGEHEHCGPYMYLKITTSPDRGVDEQGVRGSVDDLAALSTQVEQAIGDLPLGGCARLQFASAPNYSIVLDLRGDDFDPASLDENLVGAGR